VRVAVHLQVERLQASLKCPNNAQRRGTGAQVLHRIQRVPDAIDDFVLRPDVVNVQH
jgi:hypothetical protein